jgi:hypothetical protein
VPTPPIITEPVRPHHSGQTLSEAEIMKVIAHVALNVFTNLIGKSTQIPIDFPEVKLLQAA